MLEKLHFIIVLCLFYVLLQFFFFANSNVKMTEKFQKSPDDSEVCMCTYKKGSHVPKK